MIGVLDNRRTRWLLFWVVAILSILMLPYIQTFASEIGGYISEKLIDRSGVASSELVIGRSGVNNSTLDMGMGAIVSTLPATNITDPSTVLNGRLSDMNGMPQAIAYFEWGYNTSYGNTSTSQTLTGTGDFSATIGGYDSKKTIHFRAVSDTDGTLYGADQIFEVGDRPTSYGLLQNILTTIIACGIFIVCLRASGGNWIVALIMTIIGFIAIVIANAILGV